MKIIHLSDLHFGTQTNAIVDDLCTTLKSLKPDLIVISGDFTQVASSAEFQTARDFVDALPAPSFCVPGNHDIPPFKLWQRFLNPYEKYKTYIDDDLCPVHTNDTVVISGLNSARRFVPHWNWANGAISQKQLDHIKAVYEDHDPHNEKRRVCVFHHPIHEALNQPMDTVVFGARKALNVLNELKVDLVLTGHVHHASVTSLGDIDHKTIYLSASTALSSRLRKQQNGFNLIELDRSHLNVEIFEYTSETGFKRQETYKSGPSFSQ